MSESCQSALRPNCAAIFLKTLTAGVGAAVCMLLLACGGNSTASTSIDAAPSELRTVRWSVSGVLGRYTIRIGVRFGECEGLPAPRIARVKRAVRGDATYITVFSARHRPLEKGEACLGTLVERYRRIKLTKPVLGQALYDAGVSPPKVRWPKHGIERSGAESER